MNEGALATLDDDAAIARLASGALLKHIAADHGCSKVAVYKRLKRHPAYAEAIELQAEALVEEAVDQVMSCDAATVNIARARCDAAFKWAAARNPAVWGNRAAVQVNLGVIALDQGTVGSVAGLLDKLASHNAQAAPQQLTTIEAESVIVDKSET
jgi:hypothetical protein